jgi:DNA-binding IscR family transcriptional regulator
MKQNSSLSGLLHVLLHMAETNAPATSETLARAMQTNPVVIRRLMAGLRDAGFVASAKGHGGGWVLCCALVDVTLGDVHTALGAPSLIALGHRTEHATCLVEQAVNSALAAATQEAETLLLARLHRVTLATLSQDFHRRLAVSGSSLAHFSKEFDHAV